MSAQKRSHEAVDPDYADAGDQQAKRQRALEQDAKETVCKKIQNIVKTEFQNEIKAKETELQSIDTRLNQALLCMDRLRACIVATYYGQGLHTGSSKTSSLDAPPPSIHPAVKKHLGKAPKGQSSKPDINPPTASHERLAMPDQAAARVSDTDQTHINTELAQLSVSKASIINPGPVVFEERHARFKMKKKIIVGNVSKYIPVDHRESNDMSSHKWMVYVRGPKSDPDISGFVRKVWFFLHHSYKPNDLVEVSSPPFHLTRRGWGEFPVRVQLHFVDQRNKKVDIIHHLKLDKTLTGLQTLGAETVVEVEIEKDSSTTSSSPLPPSAAQSHNLRPQAKQSNVEGSRKPPEHKTDGLCNSSNKNSEFKNVSKHEVVPSVKSGDKLVQVKTEVCENKGEMDEERDEMVSFEEEYHMTIAHEQVPREEAEEQDVDVCEDAGSSGYVRDKVKSSRWQGVLIASPCNNNKSVHVSNPSKTLKESPSSDAGSGRAVALSPVVVKSEPLSMHLPVPLPQNILPLNSSLTTATTVSSQIVTATISSSPTMPSKSLPVLSFSSSFVQSTSATSSVPLSTTVVSSKPGSGVLPHSLTIIKDPSASRSLGGQKTLSSPQTVTIPVNRTSMVNSNVVGVTLASSAVLNCSMTATTTANPVVLTGQSKTITSPVSSSTPITKLPHPPHPATPVRHQGNAGQKVVFVRPNANVVRANASIVRPNANIPRQILRVVNPMKLATNGPSSAAGTVVVQPPSPQAAVPRLVRPASAPRSSHPGAIISANTVRPLVKVPAGSSAKPANAQRQVSLLTGLVVGSRAPAPQPTGLVSPAGDAGHHLKQTSSAQVVVVNKTGAAVDQSSFVHGQTSPASGHTLIKVLNKGSLPHNHGLSGPIKIVNAPGRQQQPATVGQTSLATQRLVLEPGLSLAGEELHQQYTIQAGAPNTSSLIYDPSALTPALTPQQQVVLSLPGGVTVPLTSDLPQEKMSAVGITKHGKGYRSNLPPNSVKKNVSQEDRLKGQYEVLRAFKENPELYRKKPKKVVLATNDTIEGEEDIIPHLS